jgi:predicted phosphohydrolase
MALYTIADLHLSLRNAGKSMEAFGPRWRDYTARLQQNWTSLVTPEDTVVIPGDVSWSSSLEEAEEDFAFLHALPGRKLLGKGNHDFWWSSMAKMEQCFVRNGFSSLQILHNNAYRLSDCIVCGTRGWFLEEKQQVTVGTVDHEKICQRELGRLKLSLEAARALQPPEAPLPVLVFLHFPPLWGDFRSREFLETMEAYVVRQCFFGHIHGFSSLVPWRCTEGALTLTLVASDALSFTPLRVFPAP